MDLILMQLAMENHLRGLHEQLPRPGYRTAHEVAPSQPSTRPSPGSVEHAPAFARSSNRRPDPTPERVLT